MMKSLFFKSIIFLTIVVSGVAYMEWDAITMKWDKVRSVSVSEISNIIPKKLFNSDNNMTTTVYQWQDANGNMHFGTEKPQKGNNIVKKHYRSDVNIVPSLKTSSTKTVQTKTDNEKTKKGSSILGNFQQKIQNAKDLNKTMENRTTDLDRQLDKNL